MSIGLFLSNVSCRKVNLRKHEQDNSTTSAKDCKEIFRFGKGTDGALFVFQIDSVYDIINSQVIVVFKR